MPFRDMIPPKTFWGRFLFVFTFGLISVIWVILMILGYWASDTSPPIKDLKGRFVGWSQYNPRVGIVEWTGVRGRSCDGWSYRQLVNSHYIDLEAKRITGAPLDPSKLGKEESWKVEFEVPKGFDHAGHYRIRPEYYCNPWQRTIWPLKVYPDDVPFPKPEGPSEP